MRRLVVILLLVAGLTLVARGAVPCAGWQLQPACYVALHPGPTEDTFALVEIGGIPAYSPTGELLLTTVAVEPELDLVEWLQGGFRSRVDQVLREQIFPPGADRDDVREQNVGLMVDSQLDATIAALRHLGYEFDTEFDGAEVVDVEEDSAADGRVAVGDVILAVDARGVGDNRDVVEAIRAHEPGDRVALTVVRGGATRELEVRLGAADEDPGEPLLGITVTSHLDLPVDVEIDAGAIGGPSAGLVFALSIVELLGENDLLGGTVVAASGTIDRDGNVGAIGGIRQKIQAAADPGGDGRRAQVFLVPRGNLDEAASTPIGTELLLVPVDTLDDALAALADLRDGHRPVDARALPRP